MRSSLQVLYLLPKRQHRINDLQAARVLRHHIASEDIIFRVVTLWEPPKEEMIIYLDHEYGIPQQDHATAPARCARVQAYVDKKFCEFKVDLGKKAIVSEEVLPGRHSHIDSDFMGKVGQACLEDAQVKEAVAALKLPEGATVVVEPWTYGTDGMNDMSKLVTMVCPSYELASHWQSHLLMRGRSSVLVLHASLPRPRCKLLRLPTAYMRRDVL